MSNARPFTSVLVANRGEIAYRIVREAKAAGLRAVAVYSDADRQALHVEAADQAIRIGRAPARESYLKIDAIIDAAKASGAEAIHPGYGFLAENAEFAEAVIAAGLVFIGPSPTAIRDMGDKGRAKILARKAQVPTIPGYDGEDQDDTLLAQEAARIGFPVMIKAAAGGGGRGMRRVERAEDFAEALASARREALSAFASERMILERALHHVRHIEVQIFGDAHGNIIHLGERDCSIQRRNQKIIEEAPSPFVTPELREAMGAAAVRLAKAVGYVNAGTMEFLVDDARNFYFLEMNTRIQVEHPVTEEVTGLNLIRMQFDVAMGKPLALKQSDVTITGHAIEARLCAEDPADGFKPQVGIASFLRVDLGRARVDHGLSSGQRIGGDYDSMLAKVIAKGATRDEARQKLIAAVDDREIIGIRTNARYLTDILRRPDVVAGNVDIAWLSRQPDYVDSHLNGLAGKVAALYLGNGGWRSSGVSRRLVKLRERGAAKSFLIEDEAVEGLRVVDRARRNSQTSDAMEKRYAFVKETGRMRVTDGSTTLDVTVRLFAGYVHVSIESSRIEAMFEDITYAPAERKDSAGDGVVRAPMAGKIVSVRVEPGAKVARGDLLATLEAMKMEHEIRAAADGVVASVGAKPGDQVMTRHVLVTLVAAQTP